MFEIKQLATLVVVCGLIAACGPTKPEIAKRQLMGDPEQPYQAEHAPKLGDILHIPTGIYVSQSQMFDDITDSRFVYVGETHDNPAAHRFQLEVLKAMNERYPGKLAFGLEMMVPAQQAALDKWVAGELSEPEFLRQAKWYDVWRDDFALYRDLLTYCRDNNIPVIGLNADKSLVHAVGRSTPDKLSDEIRQQLPDMSHVDEYQQAMVESVFSGHGPGGSGHAEGFKRVQTLWDQTMAENIVNYLKSPEGEGRHMVVIAGGHHIRFGYGIPRRVFRMMPDSYSIVGTKEIVIPDSKKDQVMNITLPKFPMVPYDYVAYVEYEERPVEGVKLGVLFDTSGEYLKVDQVMPDSNAERAGLQVGDLVKGFEGRPVKDMYDIKHELRNIQPGATVTLMVERGGEVVSLSAELR